MVVFAEFDQFITANTEEKTEKRLHAGDNQPAG
jgi:hypothetical protein